MLLEQLAAYAVIVLIMIVSIAVTWANLGGDKW